ncbi:MULTISPECIES: SRPBCC family protein [Olivibacter]|jgi:ligand-binding SRPBCC domain-containing protein|uniref:Cell division inhibitor n=3 Tax=Sphingobacteriaceae TaxID=84566 RepID=F4C4W6_SPHS2|nr:MULTISPECIES: SRPBCC family protein [Olivibacter]QEL04021.1 SRPBCC family protein [Olivibacter sp. LS-1]
MIEIKQTSGIYTLLNKQILPLSIDEAWSFFSAPKNLTKLTPTTMNFEITNGEYDEIYAGQIITYMVSVLPGMRTKWVTEITHVLAKTYFVDEQRFGPYALWHHEHHFKETDKGTLIHDKVVYKLPLGTVGRFVAGRFIESKLRTIFGYREAFLHRNFVQLNA